MVLELDFAETRLNRRLSLGPDLAESFGSLFAAGIEVLEKLGRAQGDGGPTLRLGRMASPSVAVFQRWFRHVEAQFPVVIETPFEGSDFIGGGAWLGSEYFDRHQADALAKLCFAKGAVDLPMHAHEHSDRFILVLEGEGRYHHAPGSVHECTGEGVRSVPVHVGDVVVFTRGLVHTFSTPAQPMTLLSWHVPHVDFNDLRQYTLPSIDLCPGFVKNVIALDADSVWSVSK